MRRFPRPPPIPRPHHAYIPCPPGYPYIGVYHPRTNAVPTKDLGRFMFGFRLKAKSEHEATQVFGWYGVGVELIPPVSCLRVHLAGVYIISTFAAWYSVFF